MLMFDALTDLCLAYTASAVPDGVPGKRSITQIYNPVGSGKIVRVDKITLTHSMETFGSVNEVRRPPAEPGADEDANRDDPLSMALRFGNQSGFDIRSHRGPVGFFLLHPRSKYLGQPDGLPIELRVHNVGGRDIGGDILYEAWMPRFTDGVYRFEAPFRLDPGWGLMTASAQDGVWTPVTFDLRIYPEE